MSLRNSQENGELGRKINLTKKFKKRMNKQLKFDTHCLSIYDSKLFDYILKINCVIFLIMISTKFLIWLLVCYSLLQTIEGAFVYQSTIVSFAYHRINIDFAPLKTNNISCLLIIIASSASSSIGTSQNTKTVLTQACNNIQQ